MKIHDIPTFEKWSEVSVNNPKIFVWEYKKRYVALHVTIHKVLKHEFVLCVQRNKIILLLDQEYNSTWDHR